MPGPIAMQLEYSLVARDVGSEHILAAREGDMGVMPRSPLAGAFLSSKYRRGNTADIGRLSDAKPFGNSKFVDRNWDILDVLTTVSAELDWPMAQVALARTLARSWSARAKCRSSKAISLRLTSG